MEPFFLKNHPANVKPSRVRAPKNTLPSAAAAVATLEDDDDGDQLPPKRQIERVEPEWRCREAAIGFHEADRYSRSASLKMVAHGDSGRLLRFPDLFTELYAGIGDAVRQSLETNPAVKKLRQLQRQYAASDKQRRLAQARIAELESQKASLEIEMPDNLAKKLRDISAKFEVQRGLLQDAEADINALEPLLGKATIAAEAVIEQTFYPLMAAAREKATERRQDILRRIGEAVTPLLSELTGFEAAQRDAANLKGDVVRQMRQHLKTAPEATVETPA